MTVINYIGITAALFLLILPYLFSSLGASSWALGSVVAACFYLVIVLMKREAIFIRWNELALCLAFIVANILVSSICYSQLPSFAQLLSIVVLVLLYTLSWLVASWLATQSLYKLAKYINSTAWIVLAASFFQKLIAFDVLPYPKHILYFSEPSHFAIGITPLAIFLCMTARRREAMLFSALLLALSLYVENATLLVLFFVCAMFALLRLGFGLSQLFVALLVGSFAAVPFVLQSAYLAPRITLSNDNLSSLVYLRGLESAQAALKEPPFFGVGFQMMGSRTNETNATLLLEELNQADLNANDGGFVAAKLVTEFGVVGIVVLCIYLVVVSKGLLSALREIGPRAISPSRCIYLASYSSVILQLFVRGSGYLGPFVCFALLAYWLRPSQSLPSSKQVGSVALT
jgi:hypothetical protein